MGKTTFSTEDIGFIALTRVVLGVGIGLLLSSAISPDSRKTVGLALLGAGAVTTVPILMRVFGEKCEDAAPIVLVA